MVAVRRTKKLVSMFRVLDILLSGLTEQNLQNYRPRVTLSGTWEVRCLPHEIRCNCLHDICKIIAHCYEQCSLLSVTRANLVDPAEDEWTCPALNNHVSKVGALFSGEQTHSNIAEPINNLSMVDVMVQRHLAHENAEDELRNRMK
jgi:hypothetical protein